MTLQVYQRSFFGDANGRPLEGKLYVGTANQDPETHAISCYWDSGFTTPASQPLTISAGYVMNGGSRAAVYVNADSYSIRVKTLAGVVVDYVADANDAALRTDLSGSTGAGIIGFSHAETYTAEIGRAHV